MESLDMRITELQETGSCSCAGLTVAQICEIVGTLGCVSREVIVQGDRLVLMRDG